MTEKKIDQYYQIEKRYWNEAKIFWKNEKKFGTVFNKINYKKNKFLQNQTKSWKNYYFPQYCYYSADVL